MVTRRAWIIDKTETVGRAGMITAMQSLAAQAGAEILRKDSTATDAATRFPAEAISGLEPIGPQLVRREDTLAATHFPRPRRIVIDGDELRAGVHPYTPATGIGLS